MSEEQKDEIDWRKEYPKWDLEAVIRAALDEVTEQDTDDTIVYFPAMMELQSRGSEAVLVRMIELLTAPQPRERRLGAIVLAQMQQEAGDYHAFQDEAVTALLDALSHEDDPEVLSEIGVALGHRSDQRAIGPLVALKNHPDADVRFGVVFGLHGLTDPVAIATLLTLTTDSDEHVRDWATFAFTMLEVDTPAIRAAMLARVDDANMDIRSEAIEALANRHDPRAVPALLAALADGANGSPIYDAAIALADPRLYPALINLRENWTGYDWNLGSLDEAIAACDPAKSQLPREDP